MPGSHAAPDRKKLRLASNVIPERHRKKKGDPAISLAYFVTFVLA